MFCKIYTTFTFVMSSRHNSKDQTALMVFSLSSRMEAERKSLFGPFKKQLSNQFFDLLIDRTARITHDCGVDVIWIDEKNQKGNSFAERFTNAFKDVFALGYEKVLSIGNDCPELTKEILLMGIHHLNHQDLVVGPSNDGGVYLIGLHKAIFDERRFSELPWMDQSLFKTIISQARQAEIEFSCFKNLSDLDEKSSVLEFAKQNQGSFISCFVYSQILCYHPICFSDQEIINIPFTGHIHSLRAPPRSY